MATPRMLQGKVALVTGSTSGIGLGMANAMAAQGADVMLNGFGDAKTIADLQKNLAQEHGVRVLYHGADMSKPSEIEDMMRATESKLGRIDILINNVGRSEPGDPVTMAEETWDDQMDVNVKSAYLMMKEVLPIMEKQGSGAVVSISSVAGLMYIGNPQVAYAAGKAALMQLTKTTAVIYAPKGVRLNTVVPGLMFTPLVQRLADKYAKGDFEGFVAHRHQQVPMGHMGEAWDVANAVLFLSSDEAKYITGQEIVVDGGITSATR